MTTKKPNICAIRAKLASLASLAHDGIRKGYGLHIRHLSTVKLLIDKLSHAGYECFISVNLVNNSFVVIV